MFKLSSSERYLLFVLELHHHTLEVQVDFFGLSNKPRKKHKEYQLYVKPTKKKPNIGNPESLVELVYFWYSNNIR